MDSTPPDLVSMTVWGLFLILVWFLSPCGREMSWQNNKTIKNKQIWQRVDVCNLYNLSEH